MATPLYKRMKENGSSFFAFPSASNDLTLAFQSQTYKLNFSKFVLLNIPKQIHKTDDVNTTSGSTVDIQKGILDFRNEWDGVKGFYMNSIESSTQEPNFSEELVESLRNYVANYDTDIRESTDGYTLSSSKTQQRKDFYNFTELKKPTEMIFWKWLRKVNGIDFEPATNKVNWLKNDVMFDNTKKNTTFDSAYFRKYLWKERERPVYSVSLIGSPGTNLVELTVSQKVKYKVGDVIVVSGSQFTADSPYPFRNGRYRVVSLIIVGDVSTITVNSLWSGNDTVPTGMSIQLEYNRLVQYVGEINAQSQVSTAKKNFTEVTAYVPHQGGRTWDVLFETISNKNYYPNLSIPILPQEKQDEIVGAQNLDSPIRQNPDNYPGLWYGQFDSEDLTYVCSNGDSERLKGDYYGINLANNVGTDAEDYFERLSDFNSNLLDGVIVDFNPNHYLKMQPADETSQSASNFDEFSAMPYGNQPPEDFEFNAVLWYYDIEDGTVDADGNPNYATNLYGITFLDNPMNDYDDCNDPSYQKITPWKKFVSNGTQDGLSYIFNLNLNFEIDNDMVPAAFSSTSVNNIFGFDLYNNVMANLAKLNENFMNVIDSFYLINTQMNDVKSLVYSQTDLDLIKKKIGNLEALLQLYKTNQIVDSDTVQVSLDYTGVYPAIRLNVVNQEYSEIETIKASTISQYNIDNSASATYGAYGIDIPLSYKKLVIIENDLTTTPAQDLSLILNTDLHNRQQIDFIVEATDSKSTAKLNIDVLYNSETSNGVSQETLVPGFNTTSIDLPIDLDYTSTSEIIKYNRSFYSHSKIEIPVDIISGSTSGTTALYVTQRNVFREMEYVYVDNFRLRKISDNSILDYSGLYQVIANQYDDTYESNPIYLIIDLLLPGTIENDQVQNADYSICSYPKVCSYKGTKLSILRIGGTGTSFGTRYKIMREIY